ncbi:MAG: hypothetical protein ACP5SG_08340 [Dissulfurimicrobium sp.]
MEARGLHVETEDPTGDLIEPIDPVTGNRLPARPLIPDPGFASNPGEVAWKPDFTGVRADLREAVLQGLIDDICGTRFSEFADGELICPQLKNRLRQEDLEALQSLVEADRLQSSTTFDGWVKQVMDDRGTPKGEVWPIGVIPTAVLDRLEKQPVISLVMLTDTGVTHILDDAKNTRGAGITFKELLDLPEKWKEAQWYIDKEDPAALVTFARVGSNKIIKFVIKFDKKIGKGRANMIITAGVVQGSNLNDPNRYEPI